MLSCQTEIEVPRPIVKIRRYPFFQPYGTPVNKCFGAATSTTKLIVFHNPALPPQHTLSTNITTSNLPNPSTTPTPISTSITTMVPPPSFSPLHPPPPTKHIPRHQPTTKKPSPSSTSAAPASSPSPPSATSSAPAAKTPRWPRSATSN